MSSPSGHSLDKPPVLCLLPHTSYSIHRVLADLLRKRYDYFNIADEESETHRDQVHYTLRPWGREQKQPVSNIGHLPYSFPWILSVGVAQNIWSEMAKDTKGPFKSKHNDNYKFTHGSWFLL